ncbi:DUF5107 domain-containing protein [Luteolibacter arcticus]|uniref:DUF5107 domain-containing protein n=1 Tax=Luteolibacter arcticus TaxID=1581411 RepID=A0ABT3GLT8_9BACT|nr:DUF5107 domain-containing protein [Luteolibacter arcticus]MCW1924452.1 DUF5107 domain-containing protein [Luteolibacter arcticus]
MNTESPATALAQQIAAGTQDAMDGLHPEARHHVNGNPSSKGETNSLRVEPYLWLAASLGGENPQAIFCDRDADMPVTARESLSPELAATIGKDCGRRVLPYRMQDRYGRERTIRDFRSIVLENEHLKATFLPELGGRLISLFHKPTQRELLFKNPVFQPANLALRDAWFAGGIEWNIGQFGHAFHTCVPVFAAAIPGLDGERGLRLYDYERRKGLLWQIDFYLPPGAQFLYACTRVINPRHEETPMYWWTNVAVPESPDVRVLAPASDSVYVQYGRDGANIAYGQCDLPALPTVGDKDASYSTNHGFSNEFFYQCQNAEMPWQAALDGRGTGFAEASTQPLNIRKLFCWGMHQGGNRWKEFLSVPHQGYLEIQAGLAPTQQHTVPMPPHSEWNWTQAFGYLEADPVKIHGADWSAAWQAADAALKKKLHPEALDQMGAICAARVDSPPLEILSDGSGWAALELTRRLARGEPGFPAAFSFPESTLGMDQQRWLDLLETGMLPVQEPATPPGEWMIQPEWLAMLESSLETPANRHWFALLQLGIMKIEGGDEAGATAAWEESIRLQPSAWAWRNLGALAVRRGVPAESLSSYRNAWDLATAAGTPDISFALEYLTALHDAGEHGQAWAFYLALPAGLRQEGTVRLLAAKVAFALDNLTFVEVALDEDYASIREGARDLTDLWFGLQAKRLAASTGCRVDDDLLQQVKSTCTPPARIDFRGVE